VNIENDGHYDEENQHDEGCVSGTYFCSVFHEDSEMVIVFDIDSP
jgi:hypothetical protein